MSRAVRHVLIWSVLLTLLLGGWQAWRVRVMLAAAPPPLAVAYTGSSTCASCHQDRHASWARTFHRSMTQDPAPAAVAGRFDGMALDAFGGRVLPGSDGTTFWFDYRDPASGADLGRVEVARLVGSHRYQQYLAKDPASQTYYRLHYLWHRADQRWVHLNAAFLGDDRQDFDAQVTTWNANCVFCHNTGPDPRLQNLDQLQARAARGESVDVAREMRFDTRVAELGIGCESCHGPGAEHVARMQRLAPRWLASLGVADASIVQPERLEASRSNAICGACHAGRVPKSAAAALAIYREGQAFRPGDALEDHVTLLAHDTPSPSARFPDLYANRFWADGAPRLTAYEYQGMNASKCAVEGELTCLRCHTMHSGNPQAMLPEDGSGDASCLRCHRDYRARIAQHSGHPAGSPGAACQACHMPRAVYGVMTIHRTHLIAVPDPAADLAAGKPNACLNCHAERTPGWARDASARLWPARGFAPVAGRHDGAPLELADGLAALLGGDPVRQAVAAFELGQVEQAPTPDALLPRVPWLLAALADDRPAVRRFSQHSLVALDRALAAQGRAIGLQPILATFDFTGPAAARAAVVARAQAAFDALDKRSWPAPADHTGLDAAYVLEPALRAELERIGASGEKQIDIGE